MGSDTRNRDGNSALVQCASGSAPGHDRKHRRSTEFFKTGLTGVFPVHRLELESDSKNGKMVSRLVYRFGFGRHICFEPDLRYVFDAFPRVGGHVDGNDRSLFVRVVVDAVSAVYSVFLGVRALDSAPDQLRFSGSPQHDPSKYF